MTTAELHIGVNLGVQKVASNVYDDFLPQEVDYYLNDSVRKYIKQQYIQIKNKEENLQSQFIHENLYTLIKTAQLTNAVLSTHLPNAVDYDLPSDYLYYLFGRTKIGNNWKNNKDLEPSAIRDHIETEYNSPIFREIPVLLSNSKATIIGDSQATLTTSTQFWLTYITKPNKINFSGLPNDELTLPEHTHEEIVDMTVDKILTVIQGRRE